MLVTDSRNWEHAYIYSKFWKINKQGHDQNVNMDMNMNMTLEGQYSKVLT